MIRSSFFIDGFNFYHALKALGAPQLKWVDLAKLMGRQISPKTERIEAIYYFSAYAYWWPDRKARHEEYVKALNEVGVSVVMGHFKKKSRGCNNCGAKWVGHEEKETDVNIALCLLNEAYKNTYDRAYIVSRDSDLKPAVAMVRSLFPSKEVIVVAPPNLGHSVDLLQVSTGKRKISRKQIEECLFGAVVVDAGGNIVAKRPSQYNPPNTL
jgi:uncharacterized LabA/DUF88 family protein